MFLKIKIKTQNADVEMQTQYPNGYLAYFLPAYFTIQFIFATIHEPLCTFNKKVFSFSKISEFQTDPKSTNLNHTISGFIDSFNKNNQYFVFSHTKIGRAHV